MVNGKRFSCTQKDIFDYLKIPYIKPDTRENLKWSNYSLKIKLKLKKKCEPINESGEEVWRSNTKKKKRTSYM